MKYLLFLLLTVISVVSFSQIEVKKIKFNKDSLYLYPLTQIRYSSTISYVLDSHPLGKYFFRHSASYYCGSSTSAYESGYSIFFVSSGEINGRHNEWLYHLFKKG